MTQNGHANSESAPPARQAINGWDADFLDTLFAQWNRDPKSVDASWQQFFAGFELGLARPVPAADAPAAAADAAATAPATGTVSRAQCGVDQLIARYREFGHLAAHLDPLGSTRPFPDALTLESVELGDAHLGQSFDAGSLPIASPSTLSQIVSQLEQTYCGSTGVEFVHITNLEQREWIQRRVEQARGKPNFSAQQQRHILSRLVDSDAFESFMALRYVGKKRFGLEGADTVIPMLDSAIETGATLGAREFCFAFAHRGRVNLLTNIVGKKYEQVLTEFEETWTAAFVDGGGDVKYHQGYSSDRATSAGTVHLTASANASHLEYVNGIALGRTRAKQDLRGDSERREVIPILVHGDSSFPGQGSVSECFNFMKLAGYDVGGALHVIINNQVGFTTNPQDVFGGQYCSDLAKAYDVPIFHVNSDDPDACVWAMQTATEFRQAFGRDALVELWCYRKNGHNETDEPAFTQPILYRRVRDHQPIAAVYRNRLVASGAISREDADALVKSVHDRMDAAQTAAKAKAVFPAVAGFEGRWKGLDNPYHTESDDTGVALATLAKLSAVISTIPDHITPHRTIARLVAARGAFDSDAKVDWATAELFAYGSLLLDGCRVRISGQDVERGTFSHRHAVVNCQDTGGKYNALATIAKNAGDLGVWNSPLTENAIVAFELGYSQTDPNALVIWEGQFGDFANGAQVIFDQFLTSGEVKWHRAAALVLLLPHGYEGQGPEHSSARIERFLQLYANESFEAVYPSTTAQMFHVLRRQLKRDFRKPLVVLTPKSMLRLPAAQSTGSDFVQGQFERVIDDASVKSAREISRLFFCSGKYFHELHAQRTALADMTCAFVRLEQLAPFPADEVDAIMQRYPQAQVHWVQEEPRNMGAYRFVQANMLDRFNVNPKYVGRPDSATPAVGSTKAHEKQAHALLTEVFPTLDGVSTQVKESASHGSAGKVDPVKSDPVKSDKKSSGRKPTANKR
ncbi:MAG: 2-oxoglutarate dehydrogenase E1 component [Phycisphaerales bacterium]|nr:2-oxoglutarate dehydrogenase E1 component [Phycisphaerales bacterium]